MAAIDVGIDTDGLDGIASVLSKASAALTDARTADDISDALGDVKSVADAILPEWLEAARKSIRDMASALSP